MSIGKAIIKSEITDRAFLESYKTLRTNILYRNDLQVIAVTSSLPNEGKTTSAYYLAKSIAESGKKVLLVDCDLRKASLNKFYKIKAQVPGLVEALTNYDDDYIYETNVENMFVSLAGHVVDNATELLSSEKYRKVLNDCKTLFDYIIVDTPPVSAASDACIIGSLVDGVIMAVRQNFTKKKVAKRCKQEIERNGGKVVGVVFTRVEQHSADYYSYGYGYGSYY